MRKLVFVIGRNMCMNKTETYRSVIVHVISHSLSDTFMASDGKSLNIEFIRHELVVATENSGSISVIKLLFHHGCRGHMNHHHGSPVSSDNVDGNVSRPILINRNIDNKDGKHMSPESNFATIYGNIDGRTMSDGGYFTECICKVFLNNLNQTFKSGLCALIAEIGRELEDKTDGAEICSSDGLGTLRFNPIRFKQCKAMENNPDYSLIQTKQSDADHEIFIELQDMHGRSDII
eukprot:878828_1